MARPRFVAAFSLQNRDDAPQAIAWLALASGIAAEALLLVLAWPPASWALVLLVAWTALPPWLFYQARRIAARAGPLGAALRCLAPLALPGAAAWTAVHALADGTDALPVATVAAPLAQMAIALPFLLNAASDTRQEKLAGG